MDEFDKRELKGRYKLEVDYEKGGKVTAYTFTDKYNPIDSFCTAITDDTYACEIKDRDISMEQYKDEGYILEYHKYKALMEAYVNSGYTPCYINYFKDGRLVWDISKLDITDRIIKKWCTATTAENYGRRIEKDVIMLQEDEAYDKQRYN